MRTLHKTFLSAFFAVSLFLLLTGTALAEGGLTPKEAAITGEPGIYFATTEETLPFANLSVALPCWGEWEEEEFPAPYPVLDYSDPVYLYSEPTTDAFVVYPLQAGDECYLLEAYIDGRWHYVEWNGVRGYIPAHRLNVTGAEGAVYSYYPSQDMRTITGYDGATLEKCLRAGLTGYGEAFARAEQDYGVNALFLISICEFESADGTSSLARNRNNLAGLGGVGNWATYPSYEACIDYLGKLLATRYLNPNSSFFHGFTTGGVCQTYCGGSAHWTTSIDKYMKNNYDLASAVEEDETL